MRASGVLTVCIVVAVQGGGAQSAAQGQGDAIVFREMFDAPRARKRWAAVSGTWDVADGALVNAETGGGRLLVGRRGWHDYACTVRMRTLRPGPRPWSVGRILFLYSDPENHYYVVLHQTGLLELGKAHEGQHKPGLATARVAARPTGWHTIAISAVDGGISVSVDGDPVLTFADPEPLVRGQAGVDAFQGSRICVDEMTISSGALAAEEAARQQVIDDLLAQVAYEPSARGAIAVFRDPDAPVRESAPSDPEYLAGLLRQEGYGVTLVGPRALGTAGFLSRQRFALLIMPYGAAFPDEASAPFREYLAQGGSFLTTGGYFADNLYGASSAEDGPRDMVVNGDFTQGLANWRSTHGEVGGLEVGAVSVGAAGETAGSLTLTPGSPVTFYSLEQDLGPVAAGSILAVDARVRTAAVEGGHGGYLALNYFREDDQRISWTQSNGMSGTTDWADVVLRGTVPSGTASVRLNLLLHGHGQVWFDRVRVRVVADDLTCVNTREGDVKGPGNSLRVNPLQVGLFAPNYRLECVARLEASAGQHVIGPELGMDLAAEGYSASGVFTGNGNPVRAVQQARTVHLFDARDALGRLRGRAGALVRNYLGPFAGSDWAAFGVNNADLFSPARPGATSVLTGVVRAMLSRVYIAEVHPEYACYRRGESVRIEARVASFGVDPVRAAVRLRAFPRERRGPSAFEATREVTLQPGGLTDVSVVWDCPSFDSDLYVVRAELRKDGTVVDSLENGFVVWNEVSLRRGPSLSAREGYLQLDGRPAFLCGTGDSGYPYFTESEDPLVWDEQFALMRDHGMRYYRCMHFFSGLGDQAGLEAFTGEMQQRLRRLDALVFLVHRHGLGFLFVNNCGLQLARDDPSALAGRRRILSQLANRYVAAGGFMFNMDHQEFIRPNDPKAHVAFRRFLAEKYATPEKFSEAWGRDDVTSYESVRFAEGPAVKAAWSSAPSRDTGEFLCSFRDAWRANGVDAVHEGNPRALFSQDFSLYWWPDFPWPPPKVLDRSDMVSAHFYGHEREFPARVKRCDMRVTGKPFALTEFGILTHSAWTGHRDVRLTHDGADAFFMMAGHYCLGLGATMMSNWNWKEMKECIFPWAIAQHDLVPKEHFRAYRNMSLLFRSFSPRYVPPEVYVVVPSALQRTGAFRLAEDAVLHCIGELLRCRVGFGLVGDEYLGRLAVSTRVLIYPAAYGVADAVFLELLGFVRRGGLLYLSGDLSLNERGERVHADRLSTLAGVELMARNHDPFRAPPEAKGSPSIRVRSTGATVLIGSEAGPRLVRHVVGQGSVLCGFEPVEMGGESPEIGPDGLQRLWAAAGADGSQPSAEPEAFFEMLLRLGGVRPLPISPRDPGVFAGSLSTTDGGSVYVLFNTTGESKRVVVPHAGTSLALALSPRRPGLAHFSGDGELLALECQDEARLDGELLWSGRGHAMFVSLDGREVLTRSQRMLVMAVGEATVQVTCASGGDAWGVELGEFRDGEWRCLRRVGASAAGATVTATGPLRSTMALVARARGLSLARRDVLRLR